MGNEATYEPGDIVILRSGGPLMTVSLTLSLCDIQHARCLYFTEEGSLETVDIPEAALTYADLEEEEAEDEPAESEEAAQDLSLKAPR